MRRSTPRARLDRLRSVPLFAGCSDRDLVHVDGLINDLRVDAGTVLTEQGTPARQAFVIVAGEADVTIDGQPIAELGPGDSVGEMGLLSKPATIRSATVVARTDMHVLVLDPRSFHALVEMPCIAKRLLNELSERLRVTDEVATHH